MAAFSSLTLFGTNNFLEHTEAAEEKQAWVKHGAFAAAINFHQPTCNQGQQWHRVLGMKCMAAESMLKGMNIDRERCLYMVDKYRTEWVDVVEKPRPEEGFSSLQEHTKYSSQKFGWGKQEQIYSINNR